MTRCRARVTVVEVGPARRPAERSGRPRRRRPRGLRAGPARRRAARGRGGRLRLAELGAADGGLRRGARAACADRPACACPCSSRTARASTGRARRGRARDRGLHRGQRDLQPQEHQRVASTSRSRASRSSCPRRAARGMWVRGYVSTCFGCPYEGAVDPGAGRGRGAPPGRRWAATRSRSATPSASAVPTQVTDVMGRLQEAVPRRALAVHFHDTRGTALANVLAALAGGHRDRGQLGGRPRRLPVRAGGQRQPRHRGPPLHAPRHGHRDRRGPGRGGGAPRGRWRRGSGHALPSRYLQACAPRSRRGLTAAMSETHTILVVDDHPDNRELLMRRLEREGFRVVGAESGRQALDHVKGARRLVDPARRDDARDERDRGAAGGARDPHRLRAARDHGDGEGAERRRGGGPRQRRQRLRHQAHRLPGRARAHPGPAPHPPPARGRRGGGPARPAARPRPRRPLPAGVAHRARATSGRSTRRGTSSWTTRSR